MIMYYEKKREVLPFFFIFWYKCFPFYL